MEPQEIKFRVWDTKQNIFLEVVHSVEDWIDRCNYWDNPREGSLLCWTSAPTYNGRLIWLQFIGKKDKNGKEIFHGDIIKNGDDLFVCKNVLTELGYMTQFTGKFKNQLGGMTDWQLGGASMDDIEIVGNIFENPEIIK